jgi:phosphatidylglycerophosphate synthase
MMKLAYIPSILVGLRLAIAPLLLLDAVDREISDWFLVGYVIAVLSDIFDGIIARRLGVSTVLLRQADSWADITLYLCIATSAWLVHPQVIRDFQVPLLVAIFAQLSLFALSLIKFHKFPSFHTYTAKVWGLALLVATVGLFGFNYPDMLWLAIGLCIVNSLEEMVMTAILPTWQCDVLSILAAIELRKGLLAVTRSPDEAN